MQNNNEPKTKAGTQLFCGHYYKTLAEVKNMQKEIKGESKRARNYNAVLSQTARGSERL